MSMKVYKYFGLTIEPDMIGPQGGCYPARFNPQCWPTSGHLNPIQGLATIFHNKLLQVTNKYTSNFFLL